MSGSLPDLSHAAADMGRDGYVGEFSGFNALNSHRLYM